MELKKTPEHYEVPGTENLKMNDMGFFEKKESDEKKPEGKYSNDYSRSSSNTGYAGMYAPDYDKGIERNSFKISEEQAEKALSLSEVEKRKRNAFIMFISAIIVYVLYLVFISLMAKACFSDRVDIMANLKTLKAPFIVAQVLFLIDALIVYTFGEKKLGLFVFAVLFSVFYPIYRHKVASGSLVGIIPTAIIAFSFAMVFATALSAHDKYGTVLDIEDQDTRHAIADLYEQKSENNHSIEVSLKKHLEIKNATYSEETGVPVLTLIGDGNISVNDISTPGKNTIDTQITFTKSEETKKYEISGVTLNEVELNERLLASYWDRVLNNY